MRVRDIAVVVARAANLPPRELLRISSGSRVSHEIARHRWLVMWIAMRDFGRSSPQVGRAINRDHASVIHGCRLMGALLKAEPYWRDLLAVVREELPRYAEEMRKPRMIALADLRA